MSDTQPLMSALSHFSMAFFAKNDRGVYLAMNGEGAEMLSSVPSKVLGKSDDSFFSAEATEVMARRDYLIMQSPRSRSFESVVRLRNGEDPICFQSVKRGLTDVTGHRVGLVGLSIEGDIRKPYVAELVYFMQELMDRHPRRLLQLMSGLPCLPNFERFLGSPQP